MHDPVGAGLAPHRASPGKPHAGQAPHLRPRCVVADEPRACGVVPAEPANTPSRPARQCTIPVGAGLAPLRASPGKPHAGQAPHLRPRCVVPDEPRACGVVPVEPGNAPSGPARQCTIPVGAGLAPHRASPGKPHAGQAQHLRPRCVIPDEPRACGLVPAEPGNTPSRPARQCTIPVGAGLAPHRASPGKPHAGQAPHLRPRCVVPDEPRACGVVRAEPANTPSGPACKRTIPVGAGLAPHRLHRNSPMRGKPRIYVRAASSRMNHAPAALSRPNPETRHPGLPANARFP